MHLDDPTHAPSLKPQLVFSTDLLSTYYKPSSVLRARMEVGGARDVDGRARVGRAQGTHLTRSLLLISHNDSHTLGK